MIVNTFSRLVTKLWARRQLKKRYFTSGIYAPVRVVKPEKVLFYLNDPARFHLGDNFFIEPLLRLFRANGIAVAIAPLAPMKFYYEADGFEVIDRPDLEDYDLIVSRIEFYDVLRIYREKTLFLNTTDAGITGFVCDYLLENIQELFGWTRGVPSHPFTPEMPFPSRLIDTQKKYIVYNPYLVSSGFLVREKHKRFLAQKARQLAAELGAEIILTGTAAERARDDTDYGFVDLDLRGKTNVEELFAISAAPNVVANVSFDALGMHLFFLYGKPSYILFRGRFSGRNAAFVLNSLNPPFKVDEAERSRLVSYL